MAGFGWINLSPTNGGVTNSGGALSGSAWGQNVGWIDFSGVTIDANSRFHGHTVAQPNFGAMTFDCDHCDVATSWRASAPSSGGGASVSGGGGNGQIVGSAASAPYPGGLQASSSATTQSPVTALQAQLQSLTAQLASLTTSKGSGQSAAKGGSAAFAFTRNL